jgi:shikimate kinase
MKALVIGASLSGKTSIVKQLRKNTEIPVSEMDEELTRLNKGEYPTDSKYKHDVLAPEIIDVILNRENIVFFTNTDYFTLDDFQKAKDKGFKIILLELSIDELLKRNRNRVKNEGYEDLSKWLRGMVEYQRKVKEAGVIDATIQANKPIEEIVEFFALRLRDI